ncbi:MAG: hypothetical protein IJW29_05890 [Clostridia bacterium]|nr:hypothetical protein [Clostridia bacterium]
MMKKLGIFLLILMMCVSLFSCEKKKEACAICDGDGIRRCYMIDRANSGHAEPHNPQTCSVCDEDGNMLCNACDGTGWAKD